MKLTPCPDCGPNRVNHLFERLAVTIDWLLQPLYRPLNQFSKITRPLFLLCRGQKLTALLADCLLRFRLGYLTDEPNEQDSQRTGCVWEEAKRRGIEMKELHLFKTRHDLFIAKFKQQTICFDTLPRPAGTISPSLAWMDDKGKMRQRFGAAGIPVSPGGVCLTKNAALRLFNQIPKPVITKPHSGSRSRHTTTHIMDEATLLEAFLRAKKLSPWVVVESELEGAVFRGTIIGGRLIAVMRREPPYLIGDGQLTVRQLVTKANEQPERQGPIFHHLPTDEAAESELKRQGLTWQSLPASGQMVTLNQKTNRGVGGTTTDVTDQTHPANVKLMEKIGAVLADPLVGVDFIMKDISQPWPEQTKCGVIECNSLPFLDLHHYPFSGRPRNVAGALWDIVLPDSARS